MGRLRVASYNVHSCIGIDRRFAPERIAEALLDIDADVVALQELGWHHRGLSNFDQFAYLEKMTGYHVIQGPTKLHNRAHYGNAILMREAAHTHQLMDLSWPLHIPRGCILAHTHWKGEPLVVINVHLGLTPWDRRRQLKQLVHEIQGHRNSHVVLMGDFNNWKPASMMFKPLSQLLPECTDQPTFHTRKAHAPLDRIYLSPGLHFDTVNVWRTAVTAKASDHLPIVADIRF
ncbi:endonuclease [Iodidimonas muriae]|uniref:Endonuclease n=1 Tax=Iodidimonas muriae TaxID=261467 RepID=A0ABQ2LFC7_9PROT|nr:endonuclease/exonuclease/phosphatase family protein [Iodidimonas muriae]GER08504.1 endonuclease [Kordiimonadales bacterium JCM 17843]GGO15295.1 endonuclease [Iodidimonas muriae]